MGCIYYSYKTRKNTLVTLLQSIIDDSSNKVFINKIKNDLIAIDEPTRKDIMSAARKTLRYTLREDITAVHQLKSWIKQQYQSIQPRYSSHLYSESALNPLHIKEVKPIYSDQSEVVDGRVVLRDNFDALFANYPEVLIFGEDSGNIGDVNQGLEGLQEKYGEFRVADAGIREATILGQGIEWR